jgi:cytochrome oxidase Cu insertion factor (SCO1/SenC/PrrC family)
MSAKPPRTERLVWVGLGLTIALLLLASLLALLKLQAGFGKPLPVYGQVADFTLTNQNGRAVSLADLRGHVWVADIIFTRCAGPCLKMSRQMKELQQALPPGGSVKLVSLTTDPDFDTPPVLKAYAERFSADPSRWWFLTGTKSQIAALAVDSLKLTAIEKKPEERQSPADLFVHSTIFVLVDKRGQLRGVYETTGEGINPEQVRSQLLAGIRRLEREG